MSKTTSRGFQISEAGVLSALRTRRSIRRYSYTRPLTRASDGLG